MHRVQNIVTGEVKDVHVVRLWFYTDKDLEMTAALEEIFQYASKQDEFEMAGMVDISDAKDGQGVYVKADWAGFDERESSWEPLATIWDGVP